MQRGVLPSISESRKTGSMTTSNIHSVDRVPLQKLPSVKPSGQRNVDELKKGSVPGRGMSPPLASNASLISFSPEKGRKQKEKPPAKIKIYHERYKHLDRHPINSLIRQINKFIAQAFKHQNTNIQEIAKSARILGIPLPRNYAQDPGFLKSKEFQVLSKEKMLKRLYKTLNESNRLVLNSTE